MFALIIMAASGLIVGSFLNVYIVRSHTGRSMAGRSGCMSCGAQLRWWELIPVVSFFALRGHCATCGSAITHQYWMVELATAALFVLVWLQDVPLWYTIIALVLVSLLVVIAVYDFRHTIIPNEVMYTFMVGAAALHIPALSTAPLSALPMQSALVALSGVLVALPLLLLWLVSQGRWMGLGDVKLAFGFGLMVGVYNGLMAVMLGFLMGAVVGSALLYGPQVIRRASLSPVGGRFTMKSEIPFAPFLIVGLFLVFFFGVDMIELANLFV